MEYIVVLGRAFPNVGASSSGDGTVYENLVWSGGNPLPTKAELDAAMLNISRSDLIVKVDSIADEVYLVAVSSPAKLLEYQEAEKEASAFKLDPENIGSFVVCWATAKGWTNDAAADDILATSERFRQAMLFIRTERLAAKESIRSSNDLTAMNQTMAVYGAKMNYLKAQLMASA